VGDGTADGTGKGESGVEVDTAELLSWGGLRDGGGGGHCVCDVRNEETKDARVEIRGRGEVEMSRRKRPAIMADQICSGAAQCTPVVTAEFGRNACGSEWIFRLQSWHSAEYGCRLARNMS
jgi:hypothetical protein